MRIEILTGNALEDALDDLARLRIAVFREWPYLYDGDMNYERDYLQVYRDNDSAIIVGAFDGDRLVGASTGTLMEYHEDAFSDAFDFSVYKPEDMFYCSESVLLPQYRGQGTGHVFFDEREAHARALGRKYISFCSVKRSDFHPLKPENPRDYEPFWQKRGYRKFAGIVAELAWKDIDRDEETLKPLQFWIKAL